MTFYTIVKKGAILVTTKRPKSGVIHGHGANTCPHHSWLKLERLTKGPNKGSIGCPECGLALGDQKLPDEKLKEIMKLNVIYKEQIQGAIGEASRGNKKTDKGKKEKEKKK